MLEESKYKSFQKLENFNDARRLAYWITGIVSFILIFFAVAPWTQTVSGKGKITTLRPEQQPHTINSVISGKIEKWFVIEGQHVKKGDTLAFISEVKAEYFNPDLLQNIESQLQNKQESQQAYASKVNALNQNIASMNQEYELKRKSLTNKISLYRNKVVSDSANLVAQNQNFTIEKVRFLRADSLFKMGIKSRKDFESAQLKFQAAENYLIASQNKLEMSRTELVNAQIDFDNYLNEFNGKVSKAQSDRFSVVSDLNNAEKEINELQNKLAGTAVRQGNYYVKALQDSYVFKTYKKGLGEIVKEGEPIISMIPAIHDLAVELYIKPMDIALIKIGERNRLVFDGWPSMIVSGWPGFSFGVFSGEVYAIDRSISQGGMYRVLIIPDSKDVEWPEQLLLGSGVNGLFLLNDVPVWYEVWRQINGFPPDYYDGGKSSYQLDEEIDNKYHTK